MRRRDFSTIKKPSLLLLIFLMACASEAPPPGGPEDETPPRVVATFPNPDTVGVDPGTEVIIEFSEYLNARSVEPAIFISPYIAREYEVNVRRRTVTIDFSESLGDSTTYIITLGTGIADLRGNKLAQSFQLAFSTGDSIDKGMMEGRIYRRNMSEGDITILAYQRDQSPIDSMLARRPDYISNPGADGRFHFGNMQTGEYFFLAVQDGNRNYLYDPGEWTGVPPNTFWTVFDSVHTDALHMKMFQYPADSLVLVKAEQQNRHQLTGGLNRAPVQKPDESSFRFISNTGDSLSPAAVSMGQSPSEFLIEHYSTQVDSPYLFLARNLTDSFGLPFGRERDRRDLTISSAPDTLPLNPPTINIPDSATNISQYAHFQVTFPRAVQSIPVDTLLSLRGVDTAGYSIRWEDDRTLVAAPDSLWPPEAWLEWTLLDSLVKDYRDSTYSDSLSTGTFQFESGTEYGVVTGQVGAPDHWFTNLIKLQASSDVQETIHLIAVDSTRNYTFRRLPPGSYRIAAFYDTDSSSSYTMGRALPFVPSEKFIIFADSVEVRARWETSGVNLKFPDQYYK